MISPLIPEAVVEEAARAGVARDNIMARHKIVDNNFFM